MRYEDNGDAVNNFVVIKVPSSKGSIESYGSQEAFLQEIQNYGLLGKQAYTGARRLEAAARLGALHGHHADARIARSLGSGRLVSAQRLTCTADAVSTDTAGRAIVPAQSSWPGEPTHTQQLAQ